MNHELAELYGEPSILTVAKAGRIRWLGHVMRMPDSCSTKKVSDSNPQFGTRRRRSLRSRWLNQVMMMSYIITVTVTVTDKSNSRSLSEVAVKQDLLEIGRFKK